MRGSGAAETDGSAGAAGDLTGSGAAAGGLTSWMAAGAGATPGGGAESAGCALPELTLMFRLPITSSTKPCSASAAATSRVTALAGKWRGGRRPSARRVAAHRYEALPGRASPQAADSSAPRRAEGRRRNDLRLGGLTDRRRRHRRSASLLPLGSGRRRLGRRALRRLGPPRRAGRRPSACRLS